jgi:hypothetical protein
LEEIAAQLVLHTHEVELKYVKNAHKKKKRERSMSRQKKRRHVPTMSRMIFGVFLFIRLLSHLSSPLALLSCPWKLEARRCYDSLFFLFFFLKYLGIKAEKKRKNRKNKKRHTCVRVSVILVGYKMERKGRKRALDDAYTTPIVIRENQISKEGKKKKLTKKNFFLCVLFCG